MERERNAIKAKFNRKWNQVYNTEPAHDEPSCGTRPDSTAAPSHPSTTMDPTKDDVANVYSATTPSSSCTTDCCWNQPQIITGCPSSVLQAVDLWSDLQDHVALPSANVHCFGPTALLANDQADLKAVVDTGASMCVTPFKQDFFSYTEESGEVINGLEAGSHIAGRGIVLWKVDAGGTTVDLKVRALHVPKARCRLLCPQQLLQEWDSTMREPSIGIREVTLHFPQGDALCPYNEANLPCIQLNAKEDFDESLHALNSCLTQENNHNLKAAHKELLKWHWKFGHLNLPRVQAILKSGVCGSSPLIKATAHLNLQTDRPLCGSCQFGKAKRHHSKTTKARGSSSSTPSVPTVPKPEKLLSKDETIPGSKISMDHFIVSTPGRLFSSRGRDSIDRSYKGGVIFVDHATGFVYVVPVVNFSAGEALRAKKEFEAELDSMGVTVLKYHTDNGVFTAAAYQDELARLGQGLTLSGVGAHHQNAVAE
jgi:hypothetical protein